MSLHLCRPPKITEGRDNIKALIRFQIYWVYSLWSKIHLEVNPIWGVNSLICNGAQNLCLFSSCVLDIHSGSRQVNHWKEVVYHLTFFLTEIFYLHQSSLWTLILEMFLWVRRYDPVEFLPRCGWTFVSSPVRPSALYFLPAKDYSLPPHTPSFRFPCPYFFLACLLGKRHHS